MRQLIVFTLTGLLLINITNIVLAAPTTRLPPAPLPSELTHSTKLNTYTAHKDKDILKKNPELAIQKRAKKKAIHKAERNFAEAFKK